MTLLPLIGVLVGGLLGIIPTLVQERRAKRVENRRVILSRAEDLLRKLNELDTILSFDIKVVQEGLSSAGYMSSFSSNHPLKTAKSLCKDITMIMSLYFSDYSKKNPRLEKLVRIFAVSVNKGIDLNRAIKTGKLQNTDLNEKALHTSWDVVEIANGIRSEMISLKSFHDYISSRLKHPAQ